MEAASAVARGFDPARHVLIAGPTASGKSALALALARDQGGVIVNADAIQVYENWRILTARPSAEEAALAPHALYGHLPADHPYSVGEWLRDVARLLQGGQRLIITGGTGLYFTALTEGLADIPETPPHIRAMGEARLQRDGLEVIAGELDAQTAARIDLRNPARVMRAWEVLKTTGKGLAQWQDDTPAPLLPLDHAQTALFDAPKDWLTPRIETRFHTMVAAGALDEARANLATWSPALPASKAIGAAELIAVLQDQMTLPEAIARATILTRQFAKRQRTWFKARMKAWQTIHPSVLA
ncbi:tRNA (adenosine(37)-N6)-dimethylallyltransferase MiaA [Tropicibacter oceani]|uniref:tRNA dimethylallyltransferase n=2 Tax=Tropicibacter oceani TaxID=3058420 RepID=A0ABY8QPH5_9RHOB|nr:tRNA (adenosine(37)-N6)-dimethylallyltransferase MiaA [Tropicibacter oceani]WGW05853.1 tRNA (adenosine(37)-N6)-dimethylallyltransferase MiaA [Tropicibacter oceani]